MSLPIAASAPRLRVGLRVDVDTHDGMRRGVPRLLDALARTGMHASFFFSMGPDRAGLAILNALRPGFVAKMRRTGAARVYGWRTVLSGTVLPARPIGTAFPALIRRASHEGHEVGVHAWDHRLWQDRLLKLAPQRIAAELDRARTAFLEAAGAAPRCFAAPAWLSCDAALQYQERFALNYASDCRGREPFLPLVNGQTLHTPQIPTTLPTLDEALGTTHTDATSYFVSIRELAACQPWPVLTIHAELEGGPFAREFDTFLGELAYGGGVAVTLHDLLADRLSRGPLPVASLQLAPVPGRHGLLATQRVPS